MVVTAGATAVGGGDFTVVVLVLVLPVVLLEVLSVLIVLSVVWADAAVAIATRTIDIKTFFICSLPVIGTSIYVGADQINVL